MSPYITGYAFVRVLSFSSDGIQGKLVLLVYFVKCLIF